MDEVDNIIIHSLRQIGCKINEDVISLSGFSPELLAETVSKCLRLIKPSLMLPDNLPQGMAQRFSVTASLAEACTSIGFKSEIGYQTFLYPNVTDIRKVFMFLIERLPKESEKLPLIQPLDKLTALENEIYQNIGVQLSNAWIPQYCNKFGVRKYDSSTYALNSSSTKFQPQLNLNIPHSLHSSDTDNTMTKIPQELHTFWLKRSPNIFQQTNSQTICSTLIHVNDIEYHNHNYEINQINEKLLNLICMQKEKCSISMQKNDNMNNNSNSIENNAQITKSKQQQQQNQQQEPFVIIKNTNQFHSPIDELNSYLEELKVTIKELLSVRKQTQLEIQKFNDIRQQNDKNLIVLKEEKKIKERTFILLENPNENLEKIETLIAAAYERMKKLEDQWEEHRRPLIEILEKSKSNNKDKTSQNKNVMKQVKQVRDKISSVSEEIKVKSGLHSQLMNELQKVNKSTSRNAYTTRILEIIGNIRKQKNDIDRVLRDTRELQKQINNISGQLDRQFTVTDDLLYKTAKRDEYSKKAYKLLAKLHSDCSDLINLVQETGAVMREVRDLEDQIEKEKARNILTNLERITIDLKQMEKDSKDIQDKIRKMENQIVQG